ncbi:MAG: phage tail tape measure protein [Chloroflexi bacterium]|nr:phage tail tape measure protein [Chloroflexota bacterium]
MATIGDVFLRLLPDDEGFEAEVKEAGEKGGEAFSTKFGQALKGQLGNMIAGAVGAVTTNIIAGGAGRATQLADAMALLSARTGESNDGLADQEQVLKDLHANNFGDDYLDLADAVATVESNLGKLAPDELEDITAAAITLRDVFGIDIAESMKAARPLVDNFALSGQQAMDLITSGLQQGGDAGQDLIDTLQEYAPFASQLGLSSEEFLAILIDGLEKGVRNTDYLGDALKEFSIRLTDNSASTRDAFEKLGLDYDDVIEKISDGSMSGADAMEMINDKLREIDNVAARDELGVALYGTKWEDVTADIVLGFDTAAGAATSLIGDIEGASTRAGDAIATGPTRQFQAWGREILAMIDNGLGPFKDVLLFLGPVLAGFGPLLTPVVSAIGAMAGVLVKQAIPALLTTGRTIMGLIAASGPIGLIITALGLLFLAWQTNFLGIQDIVKTIFGWLGDVALPWVTGIFDAIASAVSTAIGIVVGAIEGILGVVSTVASAIGGFFDFITGGSETAKNQISGVQPRTVPIAAADPKMREYQTGAWRVPQTGPAFLHADEMVVPPGAAQALRDWFGGNAFSMVAAADGGGGGGGDNITIYAEGLVRARNTSEIASGVRNVRHLKGLRRGRRFDNE